MKPITPKELIGLKTELIPDNVIKAFNEMIAEKWNGTSSTFKQDDIVERIIGATNITKEEIFDRHYLDVEEIYRKAGWDVYFDSPAYCETYAPTFKFSRNKEK